MPRARAYRTLHLHELGIEQRLGNATLLSELHGERGVCEFVCACECVVVIYYTTLYLLNRKPDPHLFGTMNNTLLQASLLHATQIFAHI